MNLSRITVLCKKIDFDASKGINSYSKLLPVNFLLPPLLKLFIPFTCLRHFKSKSFIYCNKHFLSTKLLITYTPSVAIAFPKIYSSVCKDDTVCHL